MAKVSSAGSVVSLWRYPVKSMQGEEINATDVTSQGLVGDRCYALVDSNDGKVASAKNPRKWPDLFAFRAAYLEPPMRNGSISNVRISLPDGRSVSSEQPDVHELLSRATGREARLDRRESVQQDAPWSPHLEEYWPDIEGLSNRDVVTDEAMPAGTFFDLAVVHLLTTATLDRLRELYPQGRFEVRRFRPNIVVQTNGQAGFVENDWVGRTLRIGESVRLEVTGPCPRCVMTTLPQADLPNDPGILRTAAKHNQASVGVYARVLRSGSVKRGDSLDLEA
jgi:uncharacterized protein YcbX